MDESKDTVGSTAMERLARELMDVLFCKSLIPCTTWCMQHGIDTLGTSYKEDTENARDDIERRIAEARDEDESRGAVTIKREWREKAAELDALCRVLNAESADEAVAVARALAEEHYELKELREAGRVMPEGVSWPRYEDGEQVRILDWFGDEEVLSLIFNMKGCALVARGDVYLAHSNGGDAIKRPAHKAVGADGREVKVGETVWLAHEYREKAGDYSVKEDGGRLMPECDLRGVYPDGAAKVASVVEHCVRLDTSWDAWCPASWLTHERPDSWGRLREDALKTVSEYWGCGGWECHECPASVGGETPRQRYRTTWCFNALHLDIVARAERLAGVAR